MRSRRVAVFAAASCITACAYAAFLAALVDALITAATHRHPARPR